MKRKRKKITKHPFVRFILGVLFFIPFVLYKFIMKYKNKPNKEEYQANIRNIIDGFEGVLFPDPVTEEIARKRAAICAACPKAVKKGIYSVIRDSKIVDIQGMACSVCGCGLSAKVRARNDSCPERKW